MIKKKGIKMLRIFAWLFLNVSVQTISSLGKEKNVSSTFMQTSTKRETNDRQIQGPYLLGACERENGFPIEGEKGSNCTACVKFDLTSYTLPDSFLKIHQSNLWINITQPLRNNIENIASVQTSLLTQNNTKKSTIQQIVNKGWYAIKLKHFRKHELLGTNQIVLLIDCINCEVDLKGRIVPHAVNKGSKPAKPSFKPPPIDVRPRICTSSSTGCCLDELFVEFKDIGLFTNQLIWPRGADIGHCRGSCNNPHETLNTHSSELSNQVIARNNRNNKEAFNKKPCCVPLRYDPLIILVLNETEQNVVRRKVDDMVVRECGCLV